MPIHNVQCPLLENNLTPNIVLSTFGPLLAGEVSVPSKIAEVIQKTKKEIPNPITGPALIDTGAASTCVDEEILKNLGLPIVGEQPIATPSGPSKAYLYPVKLEFPGSPIPPLEFNRVIGANLKDQKIAILIGRDILQHCILIYNGPGGHFSLSF